MPLALLLPSLQIDAVGSSFYDSWCPCVLIALALLVCCSCGTLKSWREPDRWINAAKECRLSTQQKQQLISLRVECLNRLKL